MRVLLTMLLLLAAAAVAAEERDPGGRDTVELVVAVQPDEAKGRLKVQLDMYVFNDSPVLGATAGFTWDNPSLTLDSATSSALARSGFDGGIFLYRADDVDSSNVSRQFLFGGYAITGGGLPPSTQSRRWATYYFTLSDWTTADSILVDSTLVAPAGRLFFVVPDSALPWRNQQAFVPFWRGQVIVKDVSQGRNPHRPPVPETYFLGQNYPNPFNARTRIDYEVPIDSKVTLTVYNILGQKVTTLVDKPLPPGRYVAEWDGTVNGKKEVASGVYFYTLKAGDITESRKMILLK